MSKYRVGPWPEPDGTDAVGVYSVREQSQYALNGLWPDIDPIAANDVLVIAPNTTDTTIDDKSPSAHPITNNGAGLSTAIADPWGGARKIISVGGAADLTLADDPDWDFGTGDFTVEVWINNTGTGSNDYFFSRWGGAFIDFGLLLSSSKARIFVDNGADGAYAIDLSSTSNVNSGWNHVAVTRSGTSVDLWINGTSENSTSSATDITFATQLQIAADGQSTKRFTGYIGAVRVTKGTARTTGQMMISAPPAGT